MMFVKEPISHLKFSPASDLHQLPLVIFPLMEDSVFPCWLPFIVVIAFQKFFPGPGPVDILLLGLPAESV